MKKSLRKFIKVEELKARAFAWEGSLNAFEEAFKRVAHSHMAIVHRPSWPDFIVQKHDSEIIGVEVKGPSDWISRNQRRTFDLLDSQGILKIFIWDANKPDELISWNEARLF